MINIQVREVKTETCWGCGETRPVHPVDTMVKLSDQNSGQMEWSRFECGCTLNELKCPACGDKLTIWNDTAYAWVCLDNPSECGKPSRNYSEDHEAIVVKVIEFANSRVKIDRWDLPHRKPACKADKGALGWVPGVVYLDNYWRRTWLCTGYDQTGRVVMRNVDTDEEFAHRTAFNPRHDKVLTVHDLGIRLNTRGA
jgi:hypothetical protein